MGKSKKKKIEKALQESKAQISTLTEKLIIAQNDSSEAGRKLDVTYKNMEIKQIELERLKAQVEGMKKRLIEEPEQHQKELDEKNRQIYHLKQDISNLNLQVGIMEEKANHEDELEKERREWEIAKFDYEQKNEMLQKKLVETVKLLDNKKTEAEAEAKAKYEKIIENQEKEKEKLQL